MLIITILFFTTCYAACNPNKTCTCTSVHTHEFLNYKDNLQSLFQYNTFGNIFENKCQNLGNNPRQIYTKILVDNDIQCMGDWCKEDGNNNGFDCKDMGLDCYQVEHIIDRKNTPYDPCNTNILGNVIMAYGKWNNEIGQRCWNDVKNEKIIVYGKDIFCQAIKNVIACDKNCNINLPFDCINNDIKKNDTIKNWLGYLIIIIIITIASAIIYCGYRYRDVIKNKYNEIVRTNDYSTQIQIV